jgi:Ni/Fe-hydrogenase subunit HybB-like protein
MAIMSFYFLLNRPKRMAGRQITLSYSTFMVVLALPSFITSLKTLEAGVIEIPAGTPEAYDGYYCAPVYIANSVVTTLQFLASDALLVRHTNSSSRWFDN